MRRYIPKDEDPVLGIIDDRTSASYRLRIWGPSMATLPLLAFEGATKRSKPSLKVGDIVYARIVQAGAQLGMDTTLSCQTVFGPRKEWATGESTFGVLEGGTLVRFSIHLAEELRRHDNPTMAALATAFPYEAVIGANGALWLKGKTPAQTMLLAHAFTNSLHCTIEETKLMIEKLMKKFQEGSEQGDRSHRS